MSTTPVTAPMSVLEQASIGAPITRAGVTLFPIYLSQELPASLLTACPGSLKIVEAESESVPTLSVTSLIDQPFLLLEGETLSGGLQQRTLNVSVLIAAGTRVDIPVSCVESGRWGGSRSFDGTSGHVSRRVRRAKSESVSESLRRGGNKRSNQGAVWDSVGFELHRLKIDSKTANFAASDLVFSADQGSGDSSHVSLAQAARDLVARGPLPGQCGVVVAHGSRVVAAEILGSAELLAAQWPHMVRAHILDAPEKVVGRPSASRALRFVRRLALGGATEAPGVGLGVERHVKTTRLVGQILNWEESMIHASGFALAA
ncbi:MAG: DUF6569 family protein [Microthrixaceae bacterium]